MLIENSAMMRPFQINKGENLWHDISRKTEFDDSNIFRTKLSLKNGSISSNEISRYSFLFFSNNKNNFSRILHIIFVNSSSLINTYATDNNDNSTDNDRNTHIFHAVDRTDFSNRKNFFRIFSNVKTPIFFFLFLPIVKIYSVENMARTDNIKSARGRETTASKLVFLTGMSHTHTTECIYCRAIHRRVNRKIKLFEHACLSCSSCRIHAPPR